MAAKRRSLFLPLDQQQRCLRISERRLPLLQLHRTWGQLIMKRPKVLHGQYVIIYRVSGTRKHTSTRLPATRVTSWSVYIRMVGQEKSLSKWRKADPPWPV